MKSIDAKTLKNIKTTDEKIKEIMAKNLSQSKPALKPTDPFEIIPTAPPKINPKTGLPFKINPKTGKPFKKKKTLATTPAIAAPKVQTPSGLPMTPDAFDALLDFFKKSSTTTGKAKTKTEGKVRVEKPKALCLDCSREMSTTLDAYYGKTEDASKYCSPCRHSRFGEY